MTLSIERPYSTDLLDPPNYTMDNKPLETTTDIRDLGLIVDDTLSWKTHIDTMVCKAHGRAWLCMRALGFQAELKPKKMCYITMMRSILEYGSSIWSTTFKYLIINIERIQWRATNYILKNPKRPNPLHIDYKERLQTLNLLPLSYRREILATIFKDLEWLK